MQANAHQMLAELFTKRSSREHTAALSVSGVFSPALLNTLQEAQKELAKSKEPIFDTLKLQALVRKISTRLGYVFSDFEQDQIISRLELSNLNLGVLQSLADDTGISDIIVRSYNQVEYQRGRKNFRSSITFASQSDYEAFVEKILVRCQKSCSVKNPIVDAMLDGLTRLNVIHQSLAKNGPYLTIRLNRFQEVDMADLEDAGLAPSAVLEYLHAAIRAGLTILIAGEVGTGKTTLARAIAAKIPSDESILVIEDTPEIALQHPFVRYVTSRPENIEGSGRITPADCIRAGMRMAMSRIIFGEIRDSEAAESFVDVCSSGHPGLSTIHSRSAEDAITRMELFLGRAQRGVAMEVFQQQIATAVQVIVHINFCQQTGVRRIMQVKELGRITDGKIKQTPIFSYYCTARPRWRLDHRLSNFKEKLSQSLSGYSLAALPDFLELGVSQKKDSEKEQQDFLNAWS